MNHTDTPRRGKIIILSAPSGCGKSTIIGQLMDMGDLDLHFSVSATNRPPRPGEIPGTHYHFLSDQQFRQLIAEGAFAEYEEVYPGRFYGTLRSELDRTLDSGHNIIMDIDVKGGINIRRIFGHEAISIFIQPPSIEELRRRLEQRGTETPETLADRLGKARYEIGFAPQFDHTIINDRLDTAVRQTHDLIRHFIERPE